MYAAPAELIVVSVPAVKPKETIAPPLTVILTTAPDDVPWLVPSPYTAA